MTVRNHEIHNKLREFRDDLEDADKKLIRETLLYMASLEEKLNSTVVMLDAAKGVIEK